MVKFFDTFKKFLDKLSSIKNNKKIILVRHAESSGNIKNLIYGNLDLPLTDKGINDTKNLKNNLGGSIDLIENIYSSNLIRAKQTANILLPNRKIFIKNEFSEINLGSLEGMIINEDDQDRKNYFFNEIIFNGKITGNGLESISNLENRTTKGLNECEQGISMIFTHFGIIYTIMRMFNKDMNYNFFLENLAMYAIAFNDNFENIQELGVYNTNKK